MRMKLVEVFYAKPECSEDEGFKVDRATDSTSKTYIVHKDVGIAVKKHRGGYCLDTIERHHKVRRQASELLSFPSNYFSVSTFNAPMGGWAVNRKQKYCVLLSSAKEGPVEAAVINCEGLFKDKCKSAFLKIGDKPMCPIKGASAWPVIARFSM